MEPITMKFLRIIEQNDICNLLLKNMDIANRKFSYNRNDDVLLFLRYHYIHVQFLNNKTPAQAFTSAYRREENGHNLDICVVRRLRLTQRQMQEFLGLEWGGGGVFICKYGI